MSKEETLEAVHTAVHLIGNANARISRVRREKAIMDINKALLPIVQDDSNFTAAAPVLFGSEFGRKSKEHIDQVKALRSTISKETPKRSFFRGNPLEGGDPLTGEGGMEVPTEVGGTKTGSTPTTRSTRTSALHKSHRTLSPITQIKRYIGKSYSEQGRGPNHLSQCTSRKATALHKRHPSC